MKTQTSPTQTSLILAFTIRDVHQDFMISREAIGVSPQTNKWYEYHLNRYYSWLEAQGNHSMSDAASVRNINGFLAHLRNSKPGNKKGKTGTNQTTLSDRYIHAYARTIRTLMKFAFEEHYIEQPVKFKMPPIRKNKLPVLDEDGITKLLENTRSIHDVAVITLAIASGMRLAEIVALDWGEVDLKKGRIDVLEGKGKKYRIVVIDKETLRILIKYHYELKAQGLELVDAATPVIQTDEHTRMTPMGLRSVFVRLSEKTGISFPAHALRRTFAKMAIKNGRDIIWLQALMGHANIETTRDYVQGLDIDDVDKSYQEHAPLKGIIRKSRK